MQQLNLPVISEPSHVVHLYEQGSTQDTFLEGVTFAEFLYENASVDFYNGLLQRMNAYVTESEYTGGN